MTKEPQQTTHNVERGARGTCRERSETRSSLKGTEKKVCCSLIGEISWRFGEKCSAIWRKNVAKFIGDLEDTCSVILEKSCLAILEKSCLAILEKTWSAILEKMVRRFWRNRFGDIVGDLEERGRRSYGDYILEFVMK